MKIHYTILLLFLTQLGFAQANDLVDFEIYRFCCYPAPDSIILTGPNKTEPVVQKFENIFFDTGQLRVEFENITDTSAYMNEYYKNGSKRISCSVKTTDSEDTTIQFQDGEEQVVVIRQWGYYPTGNYVEYQIPKSKNALPKIKSKGIYARAKKVGLWEFYDQYKSKNKYTINYNEQGEPSGEYKEYYYDNDTGESILRLSGSFATRNYSEEVKWKSGKTSIKEVSEVRRAGEWKYYSRNGVLLEVAEYRWVQN